MKVTEQISLRIGRLWREKKKKHVVDLLMAITLPMPECIGKKVL